jgi:general secretion pathway protein G
MKRNAAFTMVELVFVIIVIGILSAIAIPKFTQTSVIARDTRALNTVSAVKSAVNTMRQKTILRGTFVDVNKTALGYDAANHEVFGNVLASPAKVCAGNDDKDCWVVGGTETDATYTYRSLDGVDSRFRLKNSRFACETNCDKFK